MPSTPKRAAAASSATPPGRRRTTATSSKRSRRSGRSTPSSGSSRGARLLLDTSAYSLLRRGHPGALDAVAAATLVLVPTVVLGELFAGFALGSREAENVESLAELLAEPFVRTIVPTVEVARRYGGVLAALRRAGTPIPTNDLWIAACALDAGAIVLTADEHFDHVPGLLVSRLHD